MRILTLQSVSVEAVTWSRESHGLFDYESQHVSKRNLKAASSAKIIRIKNDIRLVTDIYNEKNVCENSKTLALLKHQDGVFTLTKTDNTEDTSGQAEAENFWLVVKNLKKQNDNQEYILAENDIIKLGRIKFRVKELKVLQDLTFNGNAKTTNSDETASMSHNNSQNEPPRPHKIDQTFENQEAVCRICLNSENTEKNPLISPCSCSGSVKHIHLSCLKHWIKSKSNIKSSGLSVSYSWKSLECELCHQALPESFLHNNLTIGLIDLPKPNSNYVVLESMSSERQSSKTYYVVLASAEDTIKLGRGHECDVRINDISVSRLHAFIRYSSGKFYLDDNQSKFGTLVHLKNDFRILPDYTTSVQIGRSVISFTLMTKNQSVSQQSPNLFKALSTYVTNNELSDDCDQDLDKIQSLFQRKKDPTSQNFTSISDKVQIGALSAKANSLYVTSKKEEASSLNTKLFNLTLDKDKDDYSHLQELLKNHNNKHKMDINRAKSNEDKFRERKNILNEMKNLNLGEDDDEENDENDPYNDFILRKNPL